MNDDNTNTQPAGQDQQQTCDDKSKRARDQLKKYWHHVVGVTLCIIGFVANVDTVVETTAKYLPKLLAILFWILTFVQHAHLALP